MGESITDWPSLWLGIHNWIPKMLKNGSFLTFWILAIIFLFSAESRTTDRNDEIENDYFTDPEEIEEVFPTNLARNYLNGDSFKHSNHKMKSQKTVSRKHKLNRYITLRPFNSPWLQYAICFRNFHGNKVELLLKLCMAQRNVIASKIGYPG